MTRADRIGDFVLSTPVFEALRGHFPKAWIAGLTSIENGELAIGNPFLDETLLYDKKGREAGFWGNLRFARKLAKKNFDIVIHLHATNRMHWVSWLAKIPVRIGWTRRAGWALTHPYADVKVEGAKHEAEYNFDLLKELQIVAPERLRPVLTTQVKSRASLDELVARLGITTTKPWVALSPGASCPSKRWPPERFGALADELAERHDIELILVGSAVDRHLAEKVQGAARTSLFDLTGRLSLGMLAALFERTRLLISNDSGPVHIADAVGTCVISIFGRKQPGLSPTRWRPLNPRSTFVWKDVGCVECLAHRCEIGFLCLDAIAVHHVMDQVARYRHLLEPAEVAS
ncbi:MAG: lipopolysaccharide heptosyltransferase II [Candidatus Omnitrophota bacterium]|nr:lipopolysaccharide heptosyltransferase II [Candidatus Omnitrophota bacterium]